MHWSCNYCDVIIGAIASNFTGLTIVYSIVHPGADQRNHQSSASLAFLCAGISPVTGEFPAQTASNAENVSIWWRHHLINIRSGSLGIIFCITEYIVKLVRHLLLRLSKTQRCNVTPTNFALSVLSTDITEYVNVYHVSTSIRHSFFYIWLVWSGLINCIEI